MPTSDSSTSPPGALIVPDLVRLDVPVGPDKKDVIEYLADVVASAGRADTPEGLAADALAQIVFYTSLKIAPTPCAPT